MSNATAEDAGESSNCSATGSVSDYVSCERRTLSTRQLVGGGFAIFGTLFLLLGCMCWGVAAHRRRKRRKLILAEKAHRRRVIREREGSWVEPDGTVHWQREREGQWEPSNAAQAQGSGAAHQPPDDPPMQQVTPSVRDGPEPASISTVRRAEDPLVIPYLGVPRPSSNTIPERVAANHPDMPAADADLNHKLEMRRQAERSGSNSSGSSHSSGGGGRALLGRSDTRAHHPHPAQPPQQPSVIMPSPSHYLDTSLSRSTTRPLNIRRPTIPVATDPSRPPLAHQTSLPSYDESQRLSSPYAHDAAQLHQQQTAKEPPAFRMAMHSPPRSESLDERAEDVPREVDSELEDEPGVVHTARQVMVSQPRKGAAAPSGVNVAAGSELVATRKGSGQSATTRGGMI